MTRLQEAERAGRGQRVIRATAIASLLGCHENAVLGLLQQYLHILKSSGVAQVILAREERLLASHRSELERLEKRSTGYPRSWRGLLQLLLDLTLGGE